MYRTYGVVGAKAVSFLGWHSLILMVENLTIHIFQYDQTVMTLNKVHWHFHAKKIETEMKLYPRLFTT